MRSFHFIGFPDRQVGALRIWLQRRRFQFVHLTKNISGYVCGDEIVIITTNANLEDYTKADYKQLWDNFKPVGIKHMSVDNCPIPYTHDCLDAEAALELYKRNYIFQ